MGSPPETRTHSVGCGSDAARAGARAVGQRRLARSLAGGRGTAGGGPLTRPLSSFRRSGCRTCPPRCRFLPGTGSVMLPALLRSIRSRLPGSAAGRAFSGGSRGPLSARPVHIASRAWGDALNHPLRWLLGDDAGLRPVPHGLVVDGVRVGVGALVGAAARPRRWNLRPRTALASAATPAWMRLALSLFQ
jgi:hypothetical protein